MRVIFLWTLMHHNDCADYVSQALFAGGVTKDSSWTTSDRLDAVITLSSDYTYYFVNL